MMRIARLCSVGTILQCTCSHGRWRLRCGGDDGFGNRDRFGGGSGGDRGFRRVTIATLRLRAGPHPKGFRGCRNGGCDMCPRRGRALHFGWRLLRMAAGRFPRLWGLPRALFRPHPNG